MQARSCASGCAPCFRCAGLLPLVCSHRKAGPRPEFDPRPASQLSRGRDCEASGKDGAPKRLQSFGPQRGAQRTVFARISFRTRPFSEGAKTGCKDEWLERYYVLHILLTCGGWLPFRSAPTIVRFARPSQRASGKTHQQSSQTPLTHRSRRARLADANARFAGSGCPGMAARRAGGGRRAQAAARGVLRGDIGAVRVYRLGHLIPSEMAKAMESRSRSLFA